MCRNVLCIGYVIAHWEELDNKNCVENKGWTCYPSCSLREARWDTLGLTHPLLYWQHITWASVMSMKSGQMKVKLRSISSGSLMLCHWICGFSAFSMTLDCRVTYLPLKSLEIYTQWQHHPGRPEYSKITQWEHETSRHENSAFDSRCRVHVCVRARARICM